MIRIGSRDRVWVLGGAAAAAALLAIGWFLLIGPQLTEAASLHSQASEAQRRVHTLQQRLAELKKQNADLASYQAELVADRQALPTTAASSDFLRELQAVGDRTGVSISGINLSTPVQAPKDTKIRVLPIVLTASGSIARLSDFLDQLQRVQPRAVLINTVNLAPGQGKAPDTYVLSVSLHAFVSIGSAAAPPSETPTPTPSPTPSG